jgi:hypothetical protein
MGVGGEMVRVCGAEAELRRAVTALESSPLGPRLLSPVRGIETLESALGHGVHMSGFTGALSLEISADLVHGLLVHAQIPRAQLQSQEGVEDLSALFLSFPVRDPGAWVMGCAVGGLEPRDGYPSRPIDAFSGVTAREFFAGAPLTGEGVRQVLLGRAGYVETLHPEFVRIVVDAQDVLHTSIREYPRYWGAHRDSIELRFACPWGWELLDETPTTDGISGELRRATAACCAGRSTPQQLAAKLSAGRARADLPVTMREWTTSALAASSLSNGDARARYLLAELLAAGSGTAWEPTFWERNSALPGPLAQLLLRELPALHPGDSRVDAAVAVARFIYGEITAEEVTLAVADQAWCATPVQAYQEGTEDEEAVRWAINHALNELLRELKQQQSGG